MDFRDTEEARLVKAVGPALQRAGLGRTKLLGFDHNWTLHPNDGGPADDPANPNYARDLLSDPGAARWLAGTAFHCYSGDPSAQTAPHDAFPAKDIYFSECSRPTRPRRSPTRCTGTPRTSRSARCATGRRRSSPGTSRSTRPAARTTAAAARASAS
jgi:glucosylceramidase